MRRPLAVLAAVVLGGAVALPAFAVDTVTVRARSGQSYEGTIEAGGDTHAFLLEDFAPQLFSVTLKATTGSALAPDLFLEDPTAADVTASLAPFRTDGLRSVVVRNADALQAMTPGTWVLRVGGKTGTTGGYRVKVTAKVVRVFKSVGDVPAGPDVSWFAPTGSTVRLRVVPGSIGALVPEYGALTTPPCAAADILPGLKPGTATTTAPISGSYTVGIVGNGGTQGSFNWVVRVKPFRCPKAAVRVNGGAVYFPPEGPAPARFVTNPGQGVVGFDTDGIDLCWREVRTSGNPMQNGKNSISCRKVSGKNAPGLANNFITDPAPPPRAFALGPTAAAAVSGGTLFLFPRDGGGEQSLDATLGTAVRVLVTRDSVLLLETGGIQRYDFMGTPSPVSADGSTYLDMALGGLGVVFAVETAGGDLELRTAPLAGGGDTLLAGFGANPGLQALAASGTDAFVAVDDGAGGAFVHRASSCDPGTSEVLLPLLMTPVLAMAADELNVYLVENDPLDGPRVKQVHTGGGVPMVIARGNDATGFDILGDGIVAARGFAYFLGDDGTADFYRVKRR